MRMVLSEKENDKPRSSSQASKGLKFTMKSFSIIELAASGAPSFSAKVV